jgi:hypothetical protein
MKTLFLFFSSLLSLSFLFGQQKTEMSNWKFKSILHVGLLDGETGTAFQLQTINGFNKGSWFGGIGLGLDYYKIRSIPLFLDIRKEFGKSGNRLFVYGDAGINFGWATDAQKTAYVINDHIGNGFYSDLGLGYKLRMGSSNHLVISLGYTYKKIVETYKSYNYIPQNFTIVNPGTDPGEQNRIDYYLNRVSIKLGWEF